MSLLVNGVLDSDKRTRLYWRFQFQLSSARVELSLARTLVSIISDGKHFAWLVFTTSVLSSAELSKSEVKIGFVRRTLNRRSAHRSISSAASLSESLGLNSLTMQTRGIHMHLVMVSRAAQEIEWIPPHQPWVSLSQQQQQQQHRMWWWSASERIKKLISKSAKPRTSSRSSSSS